MVHFDVKTENLLGDLRDLSNPVVKIADMGLSKRKATTFVSGNMRGTLPWMAPELFPNASAMAQVLSGLLCRDSESSVERPLSEPCLWKFENMAELVAEHAPCAALCPGRPLSSPPMPVPGPRCCLLPA